MREQRLTIAIPTYGRGPILLETVRSLLALPDRADEILVLDQTASLDEGTAHQLREWNEKGEIRWLKLPQPSIPKAMNEGLREATGEVVLFLDDDIAPDRDLVRAHRAAHAEAGCVAVAGMVLQPGEEPLPGKSLAPRGEGLYHDLRFCFRSTERAEVANGMAGNLSVKRLAALESGGFDERFVGVAYRFETEFCRRLSRRSGIVRYEPSAIIRHLKAPSGGTRAWGHHQRSSRPEHSVGDYYFAFVEGRRGEAARYALARLRRELSSRFYLTRPWYLPVRMLGEIRGIVLAARLAKGRRKTG